MSGRVRSAGAWRRYKIKRAEVLQIPLAFLSKVRRTARKKFEILIQKKPDIEGNTMAPLGIQEKKS